MKTCLKKPKNFAKVDVQYNNLPHFVTVYTDPRKHIEVMVIAFTFPGGISGISCELFGNIGSTSVILFPKSHI